MSRNIQLTKIYYSKLIHYLFSKRLDVWIMIVLYGVALSVSTLQMPVGSDRAREYEQYLLVISGEELPYFDDGLGLVSSSLMATWLPAQVQKFTGLSQMGLFKVWPCLFFSLAPPFVYLLSRKYLNNAQSVMAASLVLANFYFLYAPYLGRVSIAWGVLAVFAWALITRRHRLSIIASIFLVLSHYGVSFMTLGAVGVLVGMLLVRYVYTRIDKRLLVRVTIVFCVMGVCAGLWYYVGYSYTGKMVSTFIAHSIEVQPSEPAETSETKGALTYNTPSTIFDLNSRSLATQSAFGMTFTTMNPAQKTELIASWLVVVFISYGLFLSLRGALSIEHKILAVSMYGVTVVAVLVPFVDTHYGAIRTYFTALLILAPCFIIGLNMISKMMKVNKYIIPSLIITVCALTSSGILHGWLGYVK